MNRAHVVDVVYSICQGEGRCVLMCISATFKSVVHLEACKLFQLPLDTRQIFRELNQSCEGDWNSAHFDYSGTLIVVFGLCRCDKGNCQTCFVSVCLSFPYHPIFHPFILPFFYLRKL